MTFQNMKYVTYHTWREHKWVTTDQKTALVQVNCCKVHDGTNLNKIFWPGVEFNLMKYTII